MEQDIRDLFKKEEQLKTLPKNHKADFLEKLKTSKQHTKSKSNYSLLYRIAAILVMGLIVGYGIFKTNFNNSSLVEENALAQQIKTIETEYLANIDKEWQSFLILTKDEKLVKRFEKRLEDLDTDYKEISQQYKGATDDIFIIEILIENLQTRLQILKDIQKHIKILNQQKNEQYENTI